MAIKPITYGGASNFKANLYALEVRSRFADQAGANGYYADYGEELAVAVSGNTVTVGSGLFLVQGRAQELEPGGVSVTVPIDSDAVGYLLARIETHPGTGENCTLTVKLGETLSGIVLTQEDVYERLSEVENRIYELPLYSFRVQNNAIEIIQRLIKPIREISDIKEQVGDAVQASNQANRAAQLAAGEAETAAASARVAATQAAKETKEAIFASYYPVGSIYLSANNTNPTATMGGRWVPFGEGSAASGNATYYLWMRTA